MAQGAQSIDGQRLLEHFSLTYLLFGAIIKAYQGEKDMSTFTGPDIDDAAYEELDEDIEFPDCDEDYEEYDGQPDEAQEWYDFDPDC